MKSPHYSFPHTCFHSLFLSLTRMTLFHSYITYQERLSEERCACHGGGTSSRGAHCSKRRCGVLPLQWSGWRGAEWESLKTSGAQLHWLNHQKPPVSPFLLFLPSSPLCHSILASIFMETSQLLITAGESERGCGFWPTHVHQRGPSVQTCRHNKAASIGLLFFGPECLCTFSLTDNSHHDTIQVSSFTLKLHKPQFVWVNWSVKREGGLFFLCIHPIFAHLGDM